MIVEASIIHPRDYCRRNSLPFLEFQLPRVDLITNTPIISSPQILKVGRPYVFCGLFENVIINGIDAITVTETKEVLFHHLASWHYNTVGVLEPIYRGVSGKNILIELEEPHQFIDRECLYTGHSDVPNFGHLFWQGLSRLAVAAQDSELRELPVAVPDHLPDRWYEFYDLLGYPSERRVPYKVASPTRFRKVWMPSIPFYRGNITDGIPYIWDKAIWWLREKLLNPKILIEKRSPSRIFIGRHNAKTRRVINIGEVWSLLDSYGFIDFDPTTCSTSEQLKIVSSAEVIVVLTGGSSCVPLLAGSSCAVIELLPRGISFFVGGAPTYTSVIRQPHERIWGEPEFLPDNPSLKKAVLDPLHNRDMDYIIQIEELKLALEGCQNMDLKGERACSLPLVTPSIDALMSRL